LCAVLVVCNIGWIVRRPAGPAVSTAELEKKYPFLSRRVLADNPNDILINFVPLRKSLEQKFAALDTQKSFYFEYLPDGTSIRQGADQELIAASLIKVPLAMNLYRAAELGRIDLDKQITVTEGELDDAYGELYKRGAGFRLTLREAAGYMLRDSDNTATRVVFDHVRGLLKYDEESLARLDVDQNLQNGQAVINSRAYASVLKSLYYSSYLTKQDSQEILAELSKSSATNRLAKGVPADVPIAHKNGVFNMSWSESDCGIVYAPKRPYVICVMVGLPEAQADEFIADVSKDVYDYVVSQ
jgi:beta-lactamase class A